MKIFSRALLDELADKAAASPRKRSHHNIHESSLDPVQRFFVAAARGTYIRPHRHQTKSELALILRGRFQLVMFDDAGRVSARHDIGDGTPAIAYETPRLQWHTLLVEEDGAFLEIKEGPYDPATAVEFATWAPPEGDAAVASFLQWLRTAKTGSSFPVSQPPGA